MPHDRDPRGNPAAGGPVLSRRSMMKTLGLGAAALAGSGPGRRVLLTGRRHQDRVRGNQARGRPVLQQPGREVQRGASRHRGDPRLHLEPHRGIRPREPARHRLRQLQPDHVHLRRPRRARRPFRPAAGQAHRPEHSGSGDPVRLLPRRDEHPALLGGRRGRHLQRGAFRQGRDFFRPDHLERVPRGVREVQVREHHAGLPDFRRQLDDAAGPVRLHRRRHDRCRGVLPAAQRRGHQSRLRTRRCHSRRTSPSPARRCSA